MYADRVWRVGRAIAQILCCATASCGCAWDDAKPDSADAASTTEQVTPGYPSSTDQLVIAATHSREIRCMATLVDRAWMLTSAHCFAEVSPGTDGRLVKSFRPFESREVRFHPLAIREGMTTFEREFAASEVVAAHDLALLFVEPPITDLELARVGLLDADAGAPFAEGQQLWFGRERAGLEQTVRADIVGLVPANVLLGPGNDGELLVARGAAVIGGDSGGGAFATAAQWARPLDGSSSSLRENEALIAVVQNANPVEPREPFGLVPLWVGGHVDWIAETISAR